MYIPRHFHQTDQDAQFALIRSAPLATLVIHTPAGLVANHIPFVLDVGESVQLLGHVPRANPLSTCLATATDGLAIFHGPQGYVTPSWYASKKEHGRVVPTWNYAVVHAHGSLRRVDDPDWVLQQVHRLTESQEGQRTSPWAVSDAPADYTRRLADSLVGLELTVTRIEAKNKASQNQAPDNQRSVLAGLDQEMPESDFARHMHEVLDHDGD